MYRLAANHRSPAAADILAQARRAALSVQLNIAEGYIWKPGAKWKHHLRIALGSTIETIDALHLLLEERAVPSGPVFVLITHAERSRILINGLLK
jgi:four helix bundle protein